MSKKSLNGISVPHHKNTMECETIVMPVPDKVRIPMKQHMGQPCEPTVKMASLVKVGQVIGDSDAAISAPIHSSVSGKVVGVEDFINTDGSVCKAVVIEADHQQEVDESIAAPVVTSHAEFVAAVRASGAVGLGGAGFPTHVKLNPKNLDEINTLVVNGAECEPYITADNRTMIENADDIIDGIELVKKYMNISKVIIGIEDNKPAAIAKLTEAAKADSDISVVTLKSKYPQGGEKVLVYETTGRIIPEGGLPSDAGCIVLNVSTVAFISSYMKTGMPLISKKLTVDGGSVGAPKNVLALIGTSYRDVLTFCEFNEEETVKVMMGGPMMGIDVNSLDFPVIKNNNAILAFNAADCASAELPESACIRCGRCLRACPMGLMPAAIEKAYKAGKVEKLKALKVNLCMECGCCAYVCPAKRNLVMVNHMAKKLLKDND